MNNKRNKRKLAAITPATVITLLAQREAMEIAMSDGAPLVLRQRFDESLDELDRGIIETYEAAVTDLYSAMIAEVRGVGRDHSRRKH